MIPLLAIALTLMSNVTDFAHMFVSEKLDDHPVGLTFYFENRHEEATFALFDPNGAPQEDVLQQFSRFVRCWRTGRVKQMHPRTIELVSAIAEHFKVSRIDVVSGYRARPYGAPHSKHFLGKAMDIHVPGIKAKDVAAWVWTNFRHVGVGYYPMQDFVHVDTRDIDVRWIDYSTHGESGRARYYLRGPDSELPVDAPLLAFDRAQIRTARGANVQLAAVENVMASAYDPLQF
jgi:uncharacterized protein YcbK (DUF882 family)